MDRIDEYMKDRYRSFLLTTYADDPASYSVRVYLGSGQKFLVETVGSDAIVYEYIDTIPKETGK